MEETNKIRISLGFKPLTDDKEPVDDDDAKAEELRTASRTGTSQDREVK